MDYSFISAANDPVLSVNIFHALIIRIFHTSYYGTLPKGALKDRDLTLIEEVMNGTISETKIQLVERQTRKMILKMMESPENWSSWLQLFDEEDIYEETVAATPDPTDNTPKQTPDNSFLGGQNQRDLPSGVPKLNLGGLLAATAPHTGLITGLPHAGTFTSSNPTGHMRGWSQLGLSKAVEQPFPDKKDFVLAETNSERLEFDRLEREPAQTSRFRKEAKGEDLLAGADKVLSDLDSQFLSPRFSHYNLARKHERQIRPETERLQHRRHFSQFSDRFPDQVYTEDDLYKCESP